ncbi:hypothetical protein [Peredibacter starrii]|uniref:Uncharacterized protein n=1 Tax=Peredibacter starrii TaxID=28202 RepID=A0AAX4HUU1_9BACT|nr:hypothetical protein [Peredibacter starrii]WPU67135.1 hypothetical protein SOO65_10255 [Peredibacter starrii]
MAKLIWLACLFMFFASCNQNPDCQNQDSTTGKAATNPTTAACPIDPEPETPDLEPEPDLGELPNEALIFETKADLYNFEVADEDKVHKAFEIIKKVVGSKEFRSRVINFTYQGKKQFVDNKGMSNAEIYQAVLDGREDLRPEVDHEMDLELELYYSWRSTVGYTTPGALRIYMNTKYFYPYTPAQVAGNVFHEWTHKLGFDHDANYSVARDSSVPYALGYLMEELGKQYE